MVSRAFCGPIDRGSEGATEGEIFKAAFPPLLTLPEFPLTRLTSGHLRLRPHDRAEVYPSPAEGLRGRVRGRDGTALRHAPEQSWTQRARGRPPHRGPAPAALRTLPGGSGAPAQAPHPAVPVRQRRRAERPAGRIRSPRPHAALVCAQETQGQRRRVSAGASSPGFTRTRARCRVARPVRGRLLERPANPAPVPGALHPRGLCLSGCVLAFTVLKMKMSSLKNISLFVEKK